LPDTAPNRDELELLLDGVLAAAGPGRVLVCGDEAARIASILAMSGMEAVPTPGLPDAAVLARQKFDLIVLWHVLDSLDAAQCSRALRSLRPRVSRAVVIRTDCRNRKSGPNGEKWLEPAALDAGYRKHPLYLQLSGYERRETDGPDDLLLLEPIADDVLAKHPLGAKRDGPRDMLREAGRLADAHVARYDLATRFVRPGDTVLDVACGTGYGSDVLFRGSAAARVIGLDESKSAIAYAKQNYGSTGHVDFKAGDTARLESVADHSVDVVVSFEVPERVGEARKVLGEARRVLRPGGRLLACVPQRDSGASSWERLKSEVAERFLLEHAYRQVAGGGTNEAGVRLLREFPASEAPQPSEWLIVVGMRDPVGAQAVPYVESTFPGYEDVEGFHVARFDVDYENPWLVKALVSIGFRFDNPSGLPALAQRVREQATPGSADEGAALCVQGYAILEARGTAAADRKRLRKAIASYVAKAGDRPHQLRWKISNLYVQGLLNLADRDFDAARKSFERCAATDPTPFSPLLATKTIGAAYLAGLIAALSGDRQRARELWIGGIRSARAVFASDWTNVIGRESSPLYFGLPEVAIAVSKASKCAYALQGLESLAERPGRLWVEVSRDLETQGAREARALRHTLAALQSASAQAGSGAAMTQTAEDLRAGLDRQAVSIAEMHRAFEKQAKTIAELNAAVLERDEALSEQSRTFVKQREAFEAQARNIAAIREQLNARDSSLTTQGETITQMRRSFEEQAQNIGKLNATILEREKSLAEKSLAFGEQARNIAALRDQLNAKDAALAKQGETIAQMQSSFEQQSRNIAKLNAAILEREKSLVDKADAFEAQARNIAAIREQLNARDSSLTTQGETITQMRRSFEEQADNIGKLNATILERENALAKQGETIAQMQSSFEQQSRNIAKLNAAILEREELLAQRDAALAKQGETVARMHESFEQQSGNIAKLNAAILEGERLLGERDAALAKQGETIARMHESFEQQARNIAKLNETILEGEKLVAQRDAALATQGQTIAQMHESFEQQARNIAKLNAAILERDKALGDQSAEFVRQRDAFEAQARNIAALQQQLSGRDAALAELHRSFEALRAQNAADLEREAQTVAKLNADLLERTKSLSEFQELTDRQARTIEQSGSDLARERDAARKLSSKLQESESSRASLEGRLVSLRATWPYRMLRRWMEREQEQ
jgi:SAM-dependent methyltransferase/uncharacterized protein (DUF3084 family)